MLRVGSVFFILSLQGGATPASGQAPAPLPLFDGPAPVAIRLVADLATLIEDRGAENPERPARILVEGTDRSLPVDVRTRGNYRLRPSTCPFPPLRLDFPRKEVEGTLFSGQDKLKLVTYCRDRDSAEQEVLEEYLAYRIYAELSPWAYAVRLARVTYVDELGRTEPVTRYGFFIEDDEAMAERLGAAIVKVPVFDPRDYDPQAQVTTSLFQYMIGNTDWSIVEFHNAVLLQLADGRFIPAIYDFDISGLVDPPYAEVNPAFGIDSVRDRVYRGFCVEDIDYARVFEHFLSREAGLIALVEGLEGLSGRNRGRAQGYLDSFFSTLRSVARRDREIVGACRKVN